MLKSSMKLKIMKESEKENINESWEDTEKKDNKYLINNFIKFLDECKIDNDINTINDKNGCDNLSDKDDNKNNMRDEKSKNYNKNIIIINKDNNNDISIVKILINLKKI